MKTTILTITWPDGTQAIGTRIEDGIDAMVSTSWAGNAARIASLPEFVRDSQSFSFRDGSVRRFDAEQFAATVGAHIQITEDGEWDLSPDDYLNPEET